MHRSSPHCNTNTRKRRDVGPLPPFRSDYDLGRLLSSQDEERRQLVALIRHPGGKITPRALQRSGCSTAEGGEEYLVVLVKAGTGEGWYRSLGTVGPSPRGGHPTGVFSLV